MHVITIFLFSFLAVTSAFSAGGKLPGKLHRSNRAGTMPLSMGFFDAIFGAKSAEASHILLTGARASEQCEKIKMDIYKKAIGNGDPAAGVAPEALMKAFAQQAKTKSTCPSKASGGSLGSFIPGEMAPEFDRVAFKEQVGVIHGPVETEFGSHLILITDRK